MTAAPLTVWWGDARVGVLRATEHGALTFAYDAAWRSRRDARPLSLSLPLQEDPFFAVAHRWFANLLPEGNVREALARRLRCAPEDDLGLLAALGRDIAGALQLLPLAEKPSTGSATPALRRITPDELARWSKGAPALVDATERDVRLSLAGAQDKVPVVVVDGRDGYWLPLDDTPSTHILKFQSRAYRQLPFNEYLTTQLAIELGLPCVDLALAFAPHALLVVARYDRAHASTHTTRLHQEDLCQALGRSRNEKYEDHSQPPTLTFTACWDCVAKNSVTPVQDLRALQRWFVFNALVGNDDAHAKNLALCYDATGPRLAPFYDLVCTAAVPRVSRRSAFRVGGHDDAATLASTHWRQQARALSLREDALLREIERQHDLLDPTLATVLDAAEVHCRTQSLAQAAVRWQKAVRTRARRVAIALKPDR